LPYDAPISYAARTSSGAVGCAIGPLPPEPFDWLRRTYARLPVVVAVGGESRGVPPIGRGSEEIYYGERIEMSGEVTDLSRKLFDLMKDKKLAPRVVFHLAGSGPYKMSPLRIRGIRELVLYVEPNTESPPMVLDLALPPNTTGVNAMLDLEGGSLELIGLRIRCPNDRNVPMPPYLVRVQRDALGQGGELRLSRCQLIGPLGKAPAGFRALIAVSGPGLDGKRPSFLSVRDSLLLSGAGVVHLSEAGSQVRMTNNLCMALGPGAVLIDAPSQVGKAGGINCVFEHNTWAMRQGFLALRSTLEMPARGETVHVQATANYYVDPFDSMRGQAALLRYQEPAIGQGLLSWQGRGNVFDQRLQGYFAPLGANTAEKQTLKDWQPLWGSAGEQEAYTVPQAQAAKLPTVNPDDPELPRLALPRDPRLDALQPPPGANLVLLGTLWSR
jgi:hypothetical protein